MCVAANKGFVQSSILAKPGAASPTGSLSSLTTDDLDEVASASDDDGDSLPWLASQPAALYPDMTEVTPVSQVEASPPSGEPAFEVCCPVVV